MARKYGEVEWWNKLNPFAQSKAQKEQSHQKKATAAASAQRAKDATKKAYMAKPASERPGTLEYNQAQVAKKTKVTQPTKGKTTNVSPPAMRKTVVKKKKKD